MSEDSETTIQKTIKNPIFLGAVIGFLAALVQALLSKSGGPEAYGVCVACHTRDIVNDLFNMLTGNEGTDAALAVAPFSKNADIAVLTIVGIIVGGFLAAKLNKEFKIKKSSLLSYLLYFLGGILVLIFALLLGACPYRAALRFAYGDLVALFGIIAMAVGVFVGVKILLYKMKGEEV